MSVYELTREQMDELKSNYFWSDTYPGANNAEGLPCLFPGDIPDAIIFREYDGICFVPDDFCCTAGQ